jgi:hypothetical protein
MGLAVDYSGRENRTTTAHTAAATTRAIMASSLGDIVFSLQCIYYEKGCRDRKNIVQKKCVEVLTVSGW